MFVFLFKHYRNTCFPTNISHPDTMPARQSRAERAAERAIKKQLNKLKKPRLRSVCSQLGFDKDEWKKLKKRRINHIFGGNEDH